MSCARRAAATAARAPARGFTGGSTSAPAKLPTQNPASRLTSRPCKPHRGTQRPTPVPADNGKFGFLLNHLFLLKGEILKPDFTLKNLHIESHKWGTTKYKMCSSQNILLACSICSCPLHTAKDSTAHPDQLHPKDLHTLLLVLPPARRCSCSFPNTSPAHASTVEVLWGSQPPLFKPCFNLFSFSQILPAPL